MSTSLAEENKKAPAKRIYVGNLGANVTRDDLVNLFGVAATPYLRENCSVEISTCVKTGKSKNFAFVNVPEHVHEELMKLNGIEFYGRQLVIEEAKTQEIPKDEENKENKNKRRPMNNRNGRRPGPNNRGGRWNNPPRKKYELPVLSPDQVFHLVDGGVNMTNVKFSGYTDYIIARALASGIQKLVLTGLKYNGVKSAVVMAKTRPNILYAAVGIHPHFVKDDWKDNTLENLEELIKSPEVVAVGECGLDFKRDYSPRDLQESTFKKQVNLAARYGKALLVHDRDAHENVMEILQEFDASLPAVVIHCFTGTAEQIKAYVDRGYYIGVTGFLCKEKFGQGLRDAIKDGTLPLDRIIIQSNAPYMTPTVPRSELDPLSEKLLDFCSPDNEPCTLSIIARTIAKCISQDPREVVKTLTDNALKVFKFKKFDNVELA